MFRTYEPAQDRLVAVKVFRLDVTPEHARALADELQRVADAGLDHPSIVRVLSAGVEGTLAYSASEYVAAESLDIALRHYAPAGLDMVLPFITQLAGAVDFARTAGIGHGALHPRDIFVTPDEARATGFGVVQALEATGLRAPVRRPYTAPERVDGGSWDVAADVYSLGAIAFELITGHRPVGSEVGSLGSTAGPHGDALARVISRSLDDDPSRRYGTALAFAAALEAASHGERTTAAIEEVAGAPISADREPQPPDVHEFTVESEEAGVHPDEADLAEIQLREREPSIEKDWSDRGTLKPPVPDLSTSAPEPELPSASAPIPEPPIESEQELGAGDARQPGPPPIWQPTAVEQEPGPSLFDVDQDIGYDNPEVQHAGFQPGVLDPGYQSEPPPPEGWVPQPPAATHGRATDSRSESGWDIGDVAAREEPAREAARPRASLREAAPDASRRRSVVLPVTVTLLLGLFVGFLAGYLVFVQGGSGGVSTAQTEEATEAPAPPRAGSPAQAPERARPADTGRPEARTATAPGAGAPRVGDTAGAAPSRTRVVPTPAPARGRLLIRSNPSGASVYLNGRRRGTTPLALRDLAPGTYTVRLSRNGYTDTSQRVTVSGSSVRDVTVRLTRPSPPAPVRFTGSLYVDSRPRGARVILDGRQVGTTPMQIGDVRAGTHVVRLELADHQTWTTSARVVAGQVLRVTGSLERMR